MISPEWCLVICFFVLIGILVLFRMYFKLITLDICVFPHKYSKQQFIVIVAVYVHYHFQKQMTKHLKCISNSTFWYGDLA